MGGLAKHVLTLARALVRAGHQVDILGGDKHPIEVAGEEGQFGGRFFGELNGHDIGWKETKLGVFLPQRRTWVARRFARIILRRANDYDVVHYHGHAPNVARFIPPHINFVQTRHDQGSECLIDTRFRGGAICSATDASNCANCRVDNPNILQRAVSTMAVKRYRKEVAQGFLQHKTIFVSDMLYRNFSRSLGDKKWGTVVHNFADGPTIERMRKAAPSVRTDTNRLNVFIAAKLYPAKGVEPFLHELYRQIPANMHVTIAGDGPDAERFRQEFKSEQITFLGWCNPETTLSMTAAADLIVVPSVWEEPCATTVLEGLLFGKPTFALALGGTPELAVYSSYPDQLRLHPDMPSLVKDLVTFQPQGKVPMEHINNMACVDHALSKVVDIYSTPPGNHLNIT
jgi:glycosyltransferase involved in cell wall biosynthesis